MTNPFSGIFTPAEVKRYGFGVVAGAVVFFLVLQMQADQRATALQYRVALEMSVRDNSENLKSMTGAIVAIARTVDQIQAVERKQDALAARQLKILEERSTLFVDMNKNQMAQTRILEQNQKLLQGITTCLERPHPVPAVPIPAAKTNGSN